MEKEDLNQETVGSSEIEEVGRQQSAVIPDDEARYRQLHEIEQKYFDRLPDSQLDAYQEEIIALAGELKAKYQDVESYLLYHLLVGETPDRGRIKEFDFPGGEVENFILSHDLPAGEE